MTGDAGLIITDEDGRTVVQIDRPTRRNALSLELLTQLPQALSDAVGRGARCVIITGGPSVFSSGFDLADLPTDGPDQVVESTIRTAFAAVRHLPVPVLAAVEGPCMGAGVELALTCDLCVVSREAFFEVPAMRLGLRYRSDAILGITRKYGETVAMRLFGLGERITGEAAVAIGIASHACEPGATLALTKYLCASLARADAALSQHVKAAIRG